MNDTENVATKIIDDFIISYASVPNTRTETEWLGLRGKAINAIESLIKEERIKDLKEIRDKTTKKENTYTISLWEIVQIIDTKITEIKGEQ